MIKLKLWDINGQLITIQVHIEKSVLFPRIGVTYVMYQN